MPWKKLPYVLRDYELTHRDGAKLHTERVENFPEWQKTYFDRCATLVDLDSGITGDNRETFKKLFGKPSFHFRGEFYYYNWALELDGGKAQIILGTAQGKGTCVEVIIQAHGTRIRKDISVVLDFMQQLGHIVKPYHVAERQLWQAENDVRDATKAMKQALRDMI